MTRRNAAYRRDGLRALRVVVVVYAIVLWNLLGLLAMSLNGGGGDITDPRAMAVMALDSALLAMACFGIVLSPRVRNFATHPKRRHFYSPTPYVFLGVIGSTLALAAGLLALGLLKTGGGAVQLTF